MLISSRYTDNKLYRGMRHYDRLPLLAEDLHETSDTLYRKNAYVFNNLIGSGVILNANPPKYRLSSDSIFLDDPIILHVDGDIILVHNSESTPLHTISKEEGNRRVYLIGWYQHITGDSVIREYGGVSNNILPNDILSEPLGNIQVSSRYQFRWFLTDSSTEDTLCSIPIRDKDGNLIEIIDNVDITDSAEMSRIRKEFFEYSVSELYIISLLNVAYDTELHAISSIQFFDNRLTSKPDASQLRFDQTVYSNDIEDESSFELLLPTPISEGDVISVIYEGLTLIPNSDYTISWDEEGKGTLHLNIETRVGENLTILHNKLVLK